MNKIFYLRDYIKGAIPAAMVAVSLLNINAKDKNGVIMTVDGEEVPTEEFLYLFNKNNQQQSQPQTLEEYLELFKIYRLKVAEAKSEGVDTTAAFIKETNVYRRELLEPYITDSTLFNSFVHEAAERDKQFVESSHIMIVRTHNDEKDKKNLQLLDSLHNELLAGADFIELAKNYSQDKFSSAKGGYLGFTPAGTFPYGFETAVYETPEGEVSEIVESHVGWHIVKSGARRPAEDFNKPKRSIEEIKADVARKITSPFDPRYHKIRQHTIDMLKAKHPEINVDGESEEESYENLLKAEEKSQYNINPEYRNLVDEYVNGSLLYEVSVENVWNKASNDTEGLQEFYNENKDRYKWASPHVKGWLVQTLNDSVSNVIKDKIAAMPSDSIVPYIKKNFKKEASIDAVNVAKGSNAMVDFLMFNGEPAKPKYPLYTSFFMVEGRIVEAPEDLSDVKGSVINDYQDLLEKQWVEKLRNKHKIEVNKKELNKINKTYKH